MDILSDNINFDKIYFKNKVFVKEEIIEEIDKLTTVLKKNYISDSPFVLLSTYNHIKTLIAFYAILRSGKIAVILNPEVKSIELTEIIKDTDPAAFILINTSTYNIDIDEEVIFRSPDNNFTLKSNLDDVIVMMYTNAEDGRAKAAMITQKNLFSALDTFISIEKITENKNICALLPFYHLFGLTYGLILPCYAGCSALIADLNLIYINRLLTNIEKTKVTNIFSIPSVYYLLSKVPNIKNIFGAANDFISGGIKLNPSIYDRFYKNTGKKLREGYGLTESSPGVTLHFQDTDINLDSVGQILPNCDIKIFNESGNECKNNEQGEIRIKGDIIFKGYFNNPEASKDIINNGWLHTGDFGTKDSRGYIHFKGLKKNMYNVAGNNVYPNELERLLKMYKEVKYVKLSNETSLLQGDIIKADIELKNPTETGVVKFKKWCKKNITNFKLPKEWNFLK